MKRLMSVFAGLAVIGLTFFGTSTPANAHANETSSYPEAGTTVEAGAIPVVINFGEELMDLGEGQGNVVEIQAPDGTLVATPCWEIARTGQETSFSTTAQLAIEGKYVVHWRVVSADGHPVEGLFDFKIKNTSGFTVDPNIPACGADSTAAESPMPISAPINQPSESTNSDQAIFNWFGASAIGALLVGLVIWLVLRRTRKNE
jgi:methionine-rich copper-binding protein CopC